jgi:hypothetical protein
VIVASVRIAPYVQARRARDGIDWFIARDDLGQDGTDPQRINRLAERIRQSRRQTPSLALTEQATLSTDEYRSLDRGLDRTPAVAPGSRLITRLARQPRPPPLTLATAP